MRFRLVLILVAMQVVRSLNKIFVFSLAVFDDVNSDDEIGLGVDSSF